MLFDESSCPPSPLPPMPLAVGEGSTLPEPSIGRTSHIDWVNLTGFIDDAHYAKVLDVLQRFAGPIEDKTRTAQHYFTCRRFLEGAMVTRSLRIECERAPDHTMVTLPGAFLAKVRADGGLARVVHLLSELAACGVSKCTRIDVAVDHRSMGSAPLTLIDDVATAMRNGEYLGKPRCVDEYTSRVGQSSKGRTVYVGKRGSDGSGQLLRVYDKGLESGEAPANRWVRWEVEFSKEGERSYQVFQRILSEFLCIQKAESSGVAVDADSRLGDELLRIAYGVIDFREQVFDPHDPGRLVHHSMRPHLDWWRDLIMGVDVVHLRFVYKCSDLTAKVRWLQTTAFRVLQEFARASRRDVYHVLDQLGLRDTSPSYSFETRRAAREFASFDEAEYLGPLVT